jgi:hypothetical protein
MVCLPFLRSIRLPDCWLDITIILNFVAVDNQALKYVDNPIEDVYGMNREQMNS